MSSPTGSGPAPATLFRLSIYDTAAVELIRSAKRKLSPLLKLRDSGKLKRIEAAQTPAALLDLSPQAVGLAADAWHDRMRSFGAEGVLAIAEMLPQIRSLDDLAIRERITSLLIAELRWHGVAGVQALLEHWDSLDGFARSLACVTVGLSGRFEALALVLEHYRAARAAPANGEFIGALWAMLDLGAPDLAGELHGFLQHGPEFYELFGFLARAGKLHSLGSLLALMSARSPKEGIELGMAAAGIVHRAGREPALEALRAFDPSQAGDAEEVIDLLLTRPVQDVQQFFAIYYRGFRPEDVQEILHDLDRPLP